MGTGDRTRARMRSCSRSTLLALSPRAHSLARALMEAGSYGTPEAAHACARVGNPQFSPISPTSGTHVRQYPRGKSPERVPGSARAQGNRPSVYSPVGTPTRTCAGHDPPGGYSCGPRPASTNCGLLVSNEISTRVHIDQL